MKFKNYIISVMLIVISTALQAWEYESNQDKMSSKETRKASVTSKNTLDFPFPYNKEHNFGFLFIRQTEGKSVDVFVAIREGQILCPGYGDGCNVIVRFDDNKPSRYRAIGPNDHSSKVFFIHDTARFLAGARKANK